jgi:hypothetical protein
LSISLYDIWNKEQDVLRIPDCRFDVIINDFASPDTIVGDLRRHSDFQQRSDLRVQIQEGKNPGGSKAGVQIETRKENLSCCQTQRRTCLIKSSPLYGQLRLTLSTQDACNSVKYLHMRLAV